MQRRHTVAVVGDGVLTATAPERDRALRLGMALVDAGFVVVTGGGQGVMAAACEGAHRSTAWWSGATLGILPGHDARAANEWVDVALPTGLHVARNSVVAHADAVIGIGGGAGTLSELAMAWKLRRLVLAFRGSGWSGRLADAPVDALVRYPSIADDRVYGVDTPAQAVDILVALLPRYNEAHPGVGS